MLFMWPLELGFWTPTVHRGPSRVCSNIISFLPPSSGDEYNHHPSCHGSIALPMPEVPKMSVGAISFTSSSSNGGCWMVLVIFLFNLFSF